MNKKRLTIVVSIVLAIIILILFAFFAVNRLTINNQKFIKDGYIYNSNQKISIEENTNYKINLDKEVTFQIGEEEYEVPETSFVHYNDKSISFLTSGILLDIENIRGDTVLYYPAKKGEVIEYKNNQYVYDNKQYNNVIGKISDDKYIIMGNNVSLAFVDNSSNISSKTQKDFFEITYKDGNIVNIIADDFNYSTISSSIYIFINDNIIFDLGTKSICKFDNNIKNCIFSVEKDIEENNNSQNTEKNETTTNNNQTNQSTDGGVEGELEPKVLLENSEITFNSIKTVYDVYDPNDLIKEDLDIKVTSVANSNVVYENSINKNNLNELSISDLNSNTDYLVTISGKYTYNGQVYNKVFFQKVFKTKVFGFNLKKEVVTSHSISYVINYDSEMSFSDFTVELSSNEIGSSNDYTMSLCNDTDCVEITENKINTSLLNSYNILKVEGLESNTSYTLTFDNYREEGISYSATYLTQITQTTLKQVPIMNEGVALQLIDSNMQWNSDDVFTDLDNSITTYVYKIYDENGNLIETYRKKSLNKFNIADIGLEDNKTYTCEVSIETYDNEKSVIYDFDKVFPFIYTKDNSELITFTETDVFFDSVSGKITLNSSVIGNDFYIDIPSITDFEEMKITPNEEFTIIGLSENTEYVVNLYNQSKEYIGDFKIKTTEKPEVAVIWSDTYSYIPTSLQVTNDDENKTKQNKLIKGNYLGESIIISITDSEGKVISKNGKEFSGMVSVKDFFDGSFDIKKVLGITKDNILDELDYGYYQMRVICDSYELMDASKEFSKVQEGIINVSYIKEEGIVTGYKAEVSEGQGKFRVYDRSSCIVDKDIVQSCTGDGILNSGDTSVDKADFKFKDDQTNSYKRGGSYIFSFEPKEGETIYSEVYYPEKLDPEFKLYPVTSTSSTITYKIETSDEDVVGLYYKFDDGAEKELIVKEDNTVTLEKDDTTGTKYKIYYKADISPLYTDLKTETLVTDYLDTDSSVSSEYDVQYTYEGVNILLKNGTNINKVVGYKISSDEKDTKTDFIYDTDSCTYSDDYYGCIHVSYNDILVDNKIPNKLYFTTYYDNSITGFGVDTDYYLYQEQNTKQYVKIEKNDTGYKLTKDSAPLNMLSNKLDFEDLITSQGVKVNDTYVKLKGVSSKEEQIEISSDINDKLDDISVANVKTTSYFYGFDFDITYSNAKKDIYIYVFKDYSCSYKSIDETEEQEANQYASCVSNQKEQNPIKKVKCTYNDGKYDCDSESRKLFNPQTYYKYILSTDNYDDLDNTTQIRNVLATSTSIVGDPKYSFKRSKTLSTSDLVESANLTYTSDKENDSVKREIKLNITLADNSNIADDAEIKYSLCSNNLYSNNNNSKYCLTNTSDSNEIERDGNKVTITRIVGKDEFVYGTDYTLKLDSTIEDKATTIYNSTISVEALDETSFSLTHKVNNVGNYLMLNVVKKDEDLTLMGDFSIRLSECSSDEDERCDTVVSTLKSESEYKNYKFSNINSNKKYKVSINSSSYLENHTTKDDKNNIVGEKTNTNDYYIYINNDHVTSIGDATFMVENTFKGKNSKTLVGTYRNTYNLEEINRIIYTITNNSNGEIYSYTDDDVLLYKNADCSSNDKCDEFYYQTALDLEQFDLGSAEYNVEISYRIDDNEVDRMSTTFKFESIIYINKIEDLVELSQVVNNGDNRSNYTYILNADLDFKNANSYYDPNTTEYGDINENGEKEGLMTELTTAKGWCPIGYVLSDRISSNTKKIIDEESFAGVFDGNNHTISNLYMTRAYVNKYTRVSSGTSNWNATGLFGALDNAIVKNLNIVDADIWGGINTAILAGYTRNAKLDNISVDGRIYGRGWVSGGLVAFGSGDITNCSASGTYDMRPYSGGIIGMPVGTININSSEVTATILYRSYIIGGLVGRSVDSAKITIKNSNYSGNLKPTSISDYVGNYPNDVNSFPYYLGGIVGYCNGSNLKLENVSSSGTLDCSNGNRCAGIIGYTAWGGNINKAFSDMTINVNAKSATSYGIGGLVGIAFPGPHITNSYYVGNINLRKFKNSDKNIDGVGTLVGIYSNQTSSKIYTSMLDLGIKIENCYSTGNIKGYVKNSYGIGMIGVNTVSIKNLYNGGTISEMSDDVVTGYIYGGDGSEFSKSSTTGKSLINISCATNNTNNGKETAEELHLYSAPQIYTMKNDYGELITNEEMLDYEDENNKSWFKYLFDNSSSFNYKKGYYPTISFEGYDGKTITTPWVKIR